MSGTVRVIGFDPGFAATGWGVVEWAPASRKLSHVAHGVVKTSSRDETSARVRKFAGECNALLAHYAVSDLHVCAEAYRNYGQVHWNGVQTLYVMGALIALAAPEHTVRLIGARESKLYIGVRDGEKRTVQTRVASILGLAKAPTPQHAADGLCIALAGLRDLARNVRIVDKRGDVFAGLDAALGGA
jgi:crossover junction endodeoxyribonuclease RuvC